MKNKILWSFPIVILLALAVWISIEFIKVRWAELKEEQARTRAPTIELVVTHKYSDEEIRAAWAYVGNYNYIHKMMNASTLKCINQNYEVYKDVQKECETKIRKQYNMATDDESIRRMKQKYDEQLTIATSRGGER